MTGTSGAPAHEVGSSGGDSIASDAEDADSSYHTIESEEEYVGLTPQELVLMCLIMEIGAFQVPHAVPEG